MKRLFWFGLRLLKLFMLSAGSIAIALSLVYGGLLLRRPARSVESRLLFNGVQYDRFARDSPRPLLFHIITIDLTAPGLEFLVTPQGIDPGGKETLADTVPGFLEKQGVQVAINGGFFYPHYVRTPFNYAPHVGEGVNTVGISMSSGNLYSPPENGWAALCIASVRSITLEESGFCPEGTKEAIAGSHLIVKNGQLLPSLEAEAFDASHSSYFPRTVVAIDKEKQTMWWVLVDGRQWRYSEGIALHEIGDVLIEMGAESALNLDGGGSTTLAIEEKGRAKVLNAPFQARVPTNLRPVANHLGLYAQPAD